MDELTKRCWKCKRTLPITQFWKDRARFDGLNNKCKECRRLSDRVRYSKNYYAEKRQKEPLKYKARTIVNNMVAAGKLTKEPCFICGMTPAQGHHIITHTQRKFYGYVQNIMRRYTMEFDTPTPQDKEQEDYKLVIFGWITTVLGIPKDADPTKYNELTDRLYELFTRHTALAEIEARLDEVGRYLDHVCGIDPVSKEPRRPLLGYYRRRKAALESQATLLRRQNE